MELKATPQVAAAAFSRKIGVNVELTNSHAPSVKGNTINLPYFDHNNPEQLNTAWAYTANRAGHLRYGAKTATQDLAGIIDAAMCSGFVERKMISEYPGLQDVFNGLGNTLIKSGKLKAASPDEHPAKLLAAFSEQFYSRLLGYSSVSNTLAETTIACEEVFGKGLMVKVKAHLAEALRCQSIDDVHALSGKLMAAFELELEDDDNPPNNPRNNDQGDYSSGQDHSPSGSQPGDQGDVSPEQSDGSSAGDGHGDDSSGQSDSNNGGDSEAKGDSKASGDSSGQTDTDATPANTPSSAPGDTSNSLSKVQKDALNKALNASSGDLDNWKSQSENCADLIEPVQNPEPLLTTANMYEHNESGSSSLNQQALQQSAYLAQSLEAILATATQCNRYSTRTGRRLDKRVGQRLAIGDSRIYTREEEGLFPDTAISLLLDLSGSMQEREEQAKLAVLALAFACENVKQVSVEVLSFKDSRVDRLKSFEESAFNSKAFDVVKANGGTPLQQGISAAITSLIAQRAERHVLWVMTDGDARDNAHELVTKAKREGLTVMGLFIGNLGTRYREHMQRVFKSDWVYLRDVKDLQPKLFELASGLVEPYIA